GGCHALAAEIALRRERYAKASELFLAAREPLRAAEALKRLGEEQSAARILGDYHRDRGEDEQAAAYLAEAQEFEVAGDLYRKLENYSQAGACYQRYGDSGQAAEMYRLADDPVQAAASYERAGRFEEAAACFAELGDAQRQADALVRAGRLLQAGQTFRERNLGDEAIKVLQQIDASHPDFRPASALLGEIFRERKMLSLAVKKLRQAIGDDELGRDNALVSYTLATVYQDKGDLREAAELFEKILAFDYHYEDVEARLAQIRALLPGLPTTDPSSGTSKGEGSQPARYQILGELGRGGMGIVYKANDTVLDRVVAYKVLPGTLKENPQALRNFLREAKSAAQLNHPNIVTVYDAGEQAGSYYIAMEFVDGTTLKEIVRRKGAVPLSGVLHILVQMSEALAYAHEKKIVHRDVKTANTMWTRDRKAKIMDFGLAKVVEEVRNHTTLVSGTPYYMSPEQTLGRNVDHRTDIYSLGVTVFELATGTLPFQEGNIPYHHVHTAPPDPRELKPDLPPVLAEVISRCLRKDPGERYPSTREIVAEVRAAFGQGSASRESS
ncbi:MAG: protein kinase domain-containing protein, partial [Planctomycetota bacterium]